MTRIRLPMTTDEEKLAFLAWAEDTHPAYLNNLKKGYQAYKEASE